jgi:hypothetical protein
MPFSISHALASDLPQEVARTCAFLCKPNSEMQHLFETIAEGQPVTEDCADALVSWAHKPGYDTPLILGWACISSWQGKLAMQSFVDADYRDSKICSALCASLLFGSPTNMEVAVFSDECASVARRLRRSFSQWRCVQDGWIRVGSSEGGHGE